MFSLRLERAECEFLTGNFDTAEQLIVELLLRGASKVDQAAVYHLKILLHTVKSANEQAVASALAGLRLFGIDIPAHPTWEQVQAEYEAVWQTLNGRPIESLIDLPLMTDPEQQAAMQVLSVLLDPAYFTDFHLFCLVVCRMVNVATQHGMCGASAHAYGYWGIVLGPVFHRYREGYRSAKLACDLVEKHGFIAYRAKAYRAMGIAALWTQPITTALEFNRAAFRAASETGDLTYACYSVDRAVLILLLRNDPLDAVWRESESGLDFVRKAGYGGVEHNLVSQQRFVATMQGRTATFPSFSDAQFDEAAFEAHLMANPTAMMVFYYWILKLKTRLLSRDYAEALAAADKAKALLWISAAHIHLLDYFYYTALTVAALYENGTADEQNRWRDLMTAHREQLREWAESCPQTFADKHALVSAEIARLEGRDADAMRLYEEAIRSAGENGFVQNEGLAHEVASRFYAARGAESMAHACLRNARHCYVRWGAFGKVRQLEQLHPHLREASAPAPPTTTIGAPVERLDVGTVLKAAQAVSSEIVLGELIKTLLRIAIEHAGAGRGLLILFPGDEPRIAAEATTGRGQVEVTLRDAAPSPTELPESVLHYVIRTRESVILDDASAQNPFSADEYICQKRARSVLCLPLVKQGKRIGVLYLENNLTSHVFTPARISVLELLASQAAISLENARLYNDLQEREARIRRLVDSNIVGIVFWDVQGRIIDANQAFLDIVGYGQEDLVSGRLRWTELTPAEWRDADEQIIAELKAVRTLRPREKEYIRKDGSRVPVLVARALFEWKPDEGVSFVVDMTDRKRAEEALRESEERFRDYAETASDWLWETGPDHRVISISEHVNAVGIAPSPTTGVARWEIATDVESESEKWRLHRELLDTHQPFRDFVYSTFNESGFPVYVRVSGKPVFGAKGNFLGYRGTGADITANIRADRAEEALRKAQMELAHVTRVTSLGELTASIAHEVNQPLAAVVANAEASLHWLDRATPDLNAARRSIIWVIDDGNRASEVIRRVRALANKTSLEKTPLDVSDVVRETIPLVQRELISHQVLLRMELAPALPKILGDRVQLQQVIINLVMNGIEAMQSVTDRPRELVIRSRQDEERLVLVSVTDCGVGISAENVDRLFNAFFTTKSDGMGMGLSICRSIIEAQGGRLWATANIPHGATFQLTLPVEAETAS
jgi:PAS domain S-box-containing protein